MNNLFAKKLTELLKEKNISKRECARQTNISAQSISDWSTGKILPTAENIFILAKFFNVSADFLLGLKEERNHGRIMRLKELRTNKNLTQSELAEKIGCNQTAIGKYERKELEPNIETMIKLCEIFSCSIDYLIGREDDFGIIQSQTELPYREQKLLSFFSELDDDEKDKIIEDCEYFANKHTKVQKEKA